MSYPLLYKTHFFIYKTICMAIAMATTTRTAAMTTTMAITMMTTMTTIAMTMATVTACDWLWLWRRRLQWRRWLRRLRRFFQANLCKGYRGSPRSLTGLHLYSLEKASSIWADSADIWERCWVSTAAGMSLELGIHHGSTTSSSHFRITWPALSSSEADPAVGGHLLVLP